MNNDTIIEGNKLIAEFMGYKCYGGNVVRVSDQITTTIDDWAKYHSSWDWLMPVVEKINIIDNYEYDVIIWRSDCHINNKIEILFEASTFKQKDRLIVVVWQAVIQFIKWYNTQTKPHQ